MKQKNLFNYNFLAQRGLSNAIRLTILQSENLNASIVTINEVSKSVLRRGHVSVILEQNDDTMELITVSRNVAVTSGSGYKSIFRKKYISEPPFALSSSSGAGI